MKTLRRILVTVLCLCLVFCCSAVTAFATATDPTGSITIQNPQNSDATVAGKTFNVYKVFNATASGTSTSYSWYKDSSDNIPFYNFFYGSQGITGKQNGSAQQAVDYIANTYKENIELSQFAELLHQYVEACNNDTDTGNNIAIFASETANSGETSVTLDNLPYGYYLVYDATNLGADTSAVRSAVMLTNVNKDAVITLKANRPQILKQVLENDGETWGKGTSANIGDVVTFKITTPVPSHTLYTHYHYSVQDSLPTGLKLENDSIHVYVNDIAEGSKMAADKYAVTVPDAGDVDFKIDFTEYMKESNTGDQIIITYQATVTDEIEAQKANVNTAAVIYSNDPTNNDADAEKDSRGKSTDTANVYSYQFVFTKFAQNSNTRLAGAEFQLYRVNSDNSETLISFTTQSATNTEGGTFTKYIVYDGIDTQVKPINTLTVHSEGDAGITLNDLNYGGHLGDVFIFGLAEGTYKLVETKAPDGYVLPEVPFMITIADEIETGGAITKLSISGTHEQDDAGAIINTNGIAESILTVWAEITNKPGSALPETGGMGTALFTLVGIIMMAGAAAFFTLRKRNSQA